MITISNRYFSLLNKINSIVSTSLIITYPAVSYSCYFHLTKQQSFSSLKSYTTTRYRTLNSRLYNSKGLIKMGIKEEDESNNSNISSEEEKIRNEKRELRKQIRSKLKQLTTEEITAQSEAVWKQLFDKIPQYKDAKSVGIFLSMPNGEIHTDTALYRIIQDGKELYVPRVGTNFEEADMDMVRVVYEGPHFHNKELFYKSWDKNKWGIPEPPHTTHEECTIAQPGDVDLLLVPGCAFDKSGGRLGQGKGYYDRFILRNNLEGKQMYLAAVGLRPQFLNDDDIPMLEHDFHMDVLISPDFIWTV